MLRRIGNGSRIVLLALALVACGAVAGSAQDGKAADPQRILAGVRAYRKANAAPIVRELMDWLSVPNDAATPVDIQKNAVALEMMMERRGIAVQVFPLPTGRPVVYGELTQPGATTTLLFYCHYDGQAVDRSQWRSDPYAPVLRRGSADATGDWSTVEFPADGRFDDDWRIYARSASDDKSPIVALMAALDGLRSQGAAPRVNLKFLFDGEEEQGSPALESWVRANRELLTADLMVVGDGPVHQAGLPTIVFGNRGIMTMRLTVYGPAVSLHSGHYGNWAPNPALRLAELLATFKNNKGDVLIEGYYDDVTPLTKTEVKALADIPPVEMQLQKRMGIGQPDGDGRSLPEMLNLPSLNVRGLRSGWTGSEARTIIPSKAIAEIDVRLVKGNDHPRIFEKIVAHIRSHGWHVTSTDPTLEELGLHAGIIKVEKSDGYNAARTPMDHPAAQGLVRSVERAAQGPVVKMPTTGGSVPMYYFEDAGLPVVHVPTVNYDNNQHSPNENVRLGNFFRAIEVFASVMLWD